MTAQSPGPTEAPRTGEDWGGGGLAKNFAAYAPSLRARSLSVRAGDS